MKLILRIILCIGSCFTILACQTIDEKYQNKGAGDCEYYIEIRDFVEEKILASKGDSDFFSHSEITSKECQEKCNRNLNNEGALKKACSQYPKGYAVIRCIHSKGEANPLSAPCSNYVPLAP